MRFLRGTFLTTTNTKIYTTDTKMIHRYSQIFFTDIHRFGAIETEQKSRIKFSRLKVKVKESKV